MNEVDLRRYGLHLRLDDTEVHAWANDETVHFVALWYSQHISVPAPSMLTTLAVYGPMHYTDATCLTKKRVGSPARHRLFGRRTQNPR
ncbi:hypothetical protein DPMN_014625 [Dreissena polymorpha]|uniref:Uncharacterized protein n=1 Tax=Dreissena polymorpha TaxID=45954 RepID=A0A9D4N9J2_DREPO|nr:hypothetical protein DPMN_014625 [Dreissena polymorpha]